MRLFTEISFRNVIKMTMCYNCFQKHQNDNGICPNCGFDVSPAKREVNHLPKGTLLAGRYIIGEVCGFGGFGITYKSYDKELESIVAIKEYFPNGIVNRIPGTTDVILLTDRGGKQKIFRTGMERYIEEARTTAKYVSHRNIVNIYNFFEENNTAYIVMEYLEGITLEHYLQQDVKGQMEIEAATEIILDICTALRTIHDDRIVHRDVSPDNIFICMNGSNKLFDFGAARFSQEEGRQMTIILKPGYAPPEQYEKVNLQGPWTDIYALGGTLYTMLTGVKPIVSLDRKAAIERGEPDELPEPITLRPEIPQQLNDAVMKAMAIDRSLRFQNIAEFEAVLRSEKKVEPIAMTIRRNKRRRTLRYAAGITAGVLAIAGLGGYLRSRMQSAEFQPADITVWYIQDNAGSSDAMTQLRDRFCKDYEGLNIELVGIRSTDYAEKLLEASENGNMPALFMSDGIDTADLRVVQMENVLPQLETERYHFFDKYKGEIENSDKLPLAFNVPVLYMNTLLCDHTGDTAQDISAVCDKDDTLCVDQKLADTFTALYGQSFTIEYSPEGFYNGETPFLFSDSSDYFSVQSALPARFRMLTLEGDAIPCSFYDCWSLGDRKERNEELTAQYFLEFMLSDFSQDILYIRSRSGALPVNRNALEEYRQIYPEFARLTENTEHYSFTLQ